MVKKLISHLISQSTWRLALKSFCYACLLWFVFATHFAWFSTLIFVLGSLILYFSGNEDAIPVRVSFFTLLLISFFSFVLLGFLKVPFLVLGIGFLFAGALFYMVYGISTFLFVHRDEVYTVLHTILVFAYIALIYAARTYMMAPLVISILFIGCTVLFREFFLFHKSLQGKRAIVYGTLVSFLLIEIFGALVFTPLTAIEAAVFLALCGVVLRDSISVFSTGALTRRFLLYQITIFVSISLFIFGFSSWSL